MNATEILKLSKCDQCPYKGQTIVGSYCKTENPLFIVVGQSPGELEVKQGEVFVGPSGKLLQQMFLSIGIKKEDLYITNSIKCMPFNNEDPKAESLVACKPSLLSELTTALDKCRYRLIIAVGKVALRQLSPTFGALPIDSTVGTLFHDDELDADIFVVRHPAALLRSASQMLYQQYKIHFEKIKNYLQGSLKSYSLQDFELIDTQDKLEELTETIVKYDKPLALDIETTSLKMWKAKVISIAIYFDNKSYVINATKVDIIPFLQKVKDKDWILHNAEFDLKMIDYIYDIRLHLYWDTMQAEHVLDEEGELGLKALSVKYFNAPLYKDEVKSFWKVESEDIISIINSEESKEDAHKFFLYNARDTYYTYLLYENQVKRFETDEDSFRFYQEFTLPVINAFLDMTKYGVPVSSSKLYLVEKTLNDEISEYQKQLFEITKQEFNHRSLNTLLSILQSYGLKESEVGKTQKGAMSLTKDDLENLSKNSSNEIIKQIASLILKIRTNEKLITTYVHQLKDYIYVNKYTNLTSVSPSFKVHASKTYRINSAEPNIHNINRDSIIRTLFEAPGYLFCGFDLVSAEAYLAALLSKEERIIHFVLDPSLDQHKYTASIIYKKDVSEITKAERTNAKLGWFCVQYGGTEHAISRDFKMSLEEAKNIVVGIRKAYPRLFAYLDTLKQIARMQKELTNVFGAKKRFPTWNNASERIAINFPFQSSVSIYTHLAMIDLVNISKFVGIEKFRILFTIHDSIEFIVKEEYFPIVAAIVYKVMTQTRGNFSLLVDGEVGPDWLNMEKIKDLPINEKIEEYKKQSLTDLIKLLKQG